MTFFIVVLLFQWFSTADDGSVTWFGNTNQAAGSLLLDARTTSPPEMTTIKLSFLQWCVENAHLIVLDGFRDGVAGGLKNVTAILNKEIASATAASKLLRDMMLQAGWIEVENSQTLQLPDKPRNILEQQEAQAYSLRLANVRAALSAYEFDNAAPS